MTDESMFASFFGYMGVASSLSLANIGAAYGTAIAGLGICSIRREKEKGKWRKNILKKW